ncbi:MAG: 50S ribosomal protein L4 [Planctomycetaceae bacterium]
MVSIPIHNQSGAEVGTYDLDIDKISPAINKQLLHDVVVMYEANKRVGTVQTKSRGMVVGSTKKLYRQKGTGRARAGAARTPVRRGGGHTFGKKNRDFSYRLPKKAVRLATRMALRSKFEDGQATIVDDIKLDKPQTKAVVAMLQSLNVSGASCLLSVGQHDPTVWKSARNIPNVRMAPVSDLNAYDLLRQRNLVITKGGLDALLENAEA